MAADSDQTRVLIVEDEENLAELYRVWLADTHDVRAVHSGDAAVEVVGDRDVDVMLLDRRMPGLSGDDVARRLERRGVDTQVVMITAVSPSLEAATLPVDDYLVKPINRSELEAAVKTAELVSTYGDELTELFALTARRNKLRRGVSQTDLAASEEFAQLTDRIETLRPSLQDATVDPRDHLDVDTFTRVDDDFFDDGSHGDDTHAESESTQG